ncbi:MAG: hypothetical protein HYY86_02400 [Candidatus Harrisonbacteria bacterium]|nr:hypothetical protein [Candidatus Harrisonbacteria bacterium]
MKLKNRVFYVAHTQGGYRINALAFMEKSKPAIAAAIHDYKERTDAPLDSILVFASADSYFLKETPIDCRLSKETEIRKLKFRCLNHKNEKSKPQVKPGLPDCFECREALIKSAFFN